jgi:hypothetical protein
MRDMCEEPIRGPPSDAAKKRAEQKEKRQFFRVQRQDEERRRLAILALPPSEYGLLWFTDPDIRWDEGPK